VEKWKRRNYSPMLWRRAAVPAVNFYFSFRENPRHPCQTPPVKLFYTGPFINAEMLVAMLDKHGIAATHAFLDPAVPDDGDLSRPAQVFVPEADYDRAFKLFYTEREDEL
jgi:hypothetical protein